MSENIPKLRFPGFTEPWEQRKLGELMESMEYGLNASATQFDGENRYLRITDIDDETRKYTGTNPVSPDVNLEKAENYALREGDILFARTGASVGKTYKYQKEDGKVYFAGYLIRGRLKPKENVDFIYQQTLTAEFSKFVKATSQRSGQPGVNANEYSRYSVWAAPMEEADRVGSLFEELDRRYTLHQRKLEHLKKLKSGLLQKMFPKDGETIPEVRFPGFTGDWEQRKFKEVLTVSSGRDYKHLNEGDIPVYGTGGYMLSVDGALSWENDAIGIGRKGTIDKPYILKAPFWTVDTLFYSIPKQDFDLNFVFDLFQIIDWKLKDESTGVPSLSKTTIDKTQVWVPSYEEQVAIGCTLATFDNLITLHQRKLDHLKRLKQGLLQQMFV